MTGSAAPAMVSWQGVGVHLGGAAVLTAVDLDVERGRWLAVLGPNGAGKTTLLRTLVGGCRHSGTVVVDGCDAAGLSARERARRVAYVPQHPVIPPGVTVFDYVLLGRAPHQGVRFAPSPDDRRRSWAVVQRLDLESFADRSVLSLSGGERQRVVVARALAQEAPVLVLDEPTAFLDAGQQLDVLELVSDLRTDSGLTVVTTVHDLTLAGQFADRLAVLAGGRLVAEGSPVEVLTPDVIGAHWGVAAEVSVDADGAVAVRVQRRRERTRVHRK